MTNERALEYALDYDGCRGRRPLTRTAIRRADRAMRAAFEELARQSDCSIDDLDLDDWYRGASEFGDSETCRAIEWFYRRGALIAPGKDV